MEPEQQQSLTILCASLKYSISEPRQSCAASHGPPPAPRMARPPRATLSLSLAEEWPTVHTTVSHGLHCAGIPSPVRRTPDVQWDREPSALPGPRRSVAASDGPLTPHGFQNGLWPLTPTAQSVPTVSQFFCRMTCSSFFGMSGSGQLPGSFHGRPSHGTCKKFSSGGGP